MFLFIDHFIWGKHPSPYKAKVIVDMWALILICGIDNGINILKLKLKWKFIFGFQNFELMSHVNHNPFWESQQKERLFFFSMVNHFPIKILFAFNVFQQHFNLLTKILIKHKDKIPVLNSFLPLRGEKWLKFMFDSLYHCIRIIRYGLLNSSFKFRQKKSHPIFEDVCIFFTDKFGDALWIIIKLH